MTSGTVIGCHIASAAVLQIFVLLELETMSIEQFIQLIIKLTDLPSGNDTNVWYLNWQQHFFDADIVYFKLKPFWICLIMVFGQGY